MKLYIFRLVCHLAAIAVSLCVIIPRCKSWNMQPTQYTSSRTAYFLKLHIQLLPASCTKHHISPLMKCLDYSVSATEKNRWTLLTGF